MSAPLVITVDSYHQNPTHRRLADQVGAAHGLQTKRMFEIELTEADALVSYYGEKQDRLTLLHTDLRCDTSIVWYRRRFPHPAASHASAGRIA